MADGKRLPDKEYAIGTGGGTLQLGTFGYASQSIIRKIKGKLLMTDRNGMPAGSAKKFLIVLVHGKHEYASTVPRSIGEFELSGEIPEGSYYIIVKNSNGKKICGYPVKVNKKFTENIEIFCRVR